MRVVARDPLRIPQEIRQRVEVIQGSHGDGATIEKALTGADALFWLIPPEPLINLNSVDKAYVDFTRPAADALRRCGVKHVVAASNWLPDVYWQFSDNLCDRNQNLLRSDGLLKSLSTRNHPALPRRSFLGVVTIEVKSEDVLRLVRRADSNGAGDRSR